MFQFSRGYQRPWLFNYSVRTYFSQGVLDIGATCHFHITMTTAHTFVAQACLGVLLHLDKGVNEEELTNFPLVKYAADYW